MVMEPSINLVQAVNDIIVSFEITSELQANAACVIRMPTGLQIPLTSQSVTIEPMTIDGRRETQASSGVFIG